MKTKQKLKQTPIYCNHCSPMATWSLLRSEVYHYSGLSAIFKNPAYGRHLNPTLRARSKHQLLLCWTAAPATLFNQWLNSRGAELQLNSGSSAQITQWEPYKKIKSGRTDITITRPTRPKGPTWCNRRVESKEKTLRDRKRLPWVHSPVVELSSYSCQTTFCQK